MSQPKGAPPQSDGTESEEFRRKYQATDSDWGQSSGPGSNPYYTVEYRAFLEKFIKMNNVRSVVDVGCGDWQFSRFIDFTNVNYIGFDVVEDLVKKNIRLYGSKNTQFSMMPSDISLLPSADLIVMKDVLQHLPYDMIQNFKENVFPKFNYCLLTNSFEKLSARTNIDVKNGDFRCLDFTQPPYLWNGVCLLEFGSPLWERIRTFLLYPGKSRSL